MRGSLFLLGPLYDEQWEELFEQLMRVHAAPPALRSSIPQRRALGRAMQHGSDRRQQFIHRFRAALDWPRGDSN
jgi:hypothetical protein